MKCPRCQGLVVTQYGETRCLICAWYLNEPLPQRPTVDGRLKNVGNFYGHRSDPNNPTCAHGHARTLANTYTYQLGGGRTLKKCRVCARMRYRKVRA